MQPNNQELANLYWCQAHLDLHQAKAMHRKQSVYANSVAYQAMMNLFSALLAAERKYQQPAYNLCEMLQEIEHQYPGLQQIKEACMELDEILEKTFIIQPTADQKNVHTEQGGEYYRLIEKTFVLAKKIVKACDHYKAPFWNQKPAVLIRLLYLRKKNHPTT